MKKLIVLILTYANGDTEIREFKNLMPYLNNGCLNYNDRDVLCSVRSYTIIKEDKHPHVW